MGSRAARSRQKVAENWRPVLELPAGSTEKELAEPSADAGYLLDQLMRRGLRAEQSQVDGLPKLNLLSI